jgi:hypothetical protein
MKKVTAVILSLAITAFIFTACAKKNPTMPLSSMPSAIVIASAVPTPGALTPTPTPQEQALVLVDNCDGDTNQNQLKGLWTSYDDNSPPNFGNSLVLPQKGGKFYMSYVTDWISPPPGKYSPTWPATNVYAARLQGTLNLKARYNLIGMETGMNYTASPVDLSAYRQVIFWAKVGTDDQISSRAGNTHTPTGGAGYRFSLVSSNNPNTALYDMYGATINPPTAWTQFVLNFNPNASADAGGDFGISFGTNIGWTDNDAADGIPTINFNQGAITHVTDLEMQTKTSASGTPLTVDLWIDSIYLVRAN